MAERLKDYQFHNHRAIWSVMCNETKAHEEKSCVPSRWTPRPNATSCASFLSGWLTGVSRTRAQLLNLRAFVDASPPFQIGRGGKKQGCWARTYFQNSIVGDGFDSISLPQFQKCQTRSLKKVLSPAERCKIFEKSKLCLNPLEIGCSQAASETRWVGRRKPIKTQGWKVPVGC